MKNIDRILSQVTDSTSDNFSRVYGQSGNCPDCGRAYELKPIYGATIWTPVCDCIDRRREENRAVLRAQYQKQLKVQHIAELFEQSKLGARFAERTIESWQERLGTEKAFAAVVQYVANWEKHTTEGSGLLLFGGVGNGKSHLAAAVVNALIPKGVSAVFQSAPDLLRLFRSSYDEDSKVKEQQLMDALAEVDLLVLDDLGAEKWTEYSEAQLYQVIDTRYRHKKPLIVTTNLGIVKEPLLELYIGPRSLDRLIEMCDLIEDGGKIGRAPCRERV